MAKTWVIADTHFSHHNMTQFTRKNGEKLRPFESASEMDEHMIEQWNSRVDDKDRVYHLGDLTTSRRALNEIMPRLKGRLVLVKGNHDMFKLRDYKKYFDDIRAVIVKPKIGLTLSHYPIHPASLNTVPFNVHGHIHEKRVMLDEVNEDMRYICVSVENTDYAPVLLDDLVQLAETRQGVLL